MREILPIVEPGKYRVKYDLGIHKKAGLTCERIQKRLKGGEIIEINKIKYLRYSVWGQISEGWICMYMNRTEYVCPCRQRRML